MKTHAPFVLALEPDHRQASVLKRVIRDRVHAELMVVDSRDAAVAATSNRIPDVILLTALLSPRDEAELIAHLRGLAGAEHVQTHTIPQLASSHHDGDPAQAQGGLLGKLRWKKTADQPIPGCDPTAFADEVGTFIARAAEMKAHAAASPAPPVVKARDTRTHDQPVNSAPPAGSDDQPVPEVSSAWSSPFEWRPSEPAAQKSERKREPAAPRTPLVTNAPLAVLAEEEETRRADADRRGREGAEKERAARAEAEAKRERERLEAEAAAKRERERLEAEAAAKRERERLEAEAAAKRERERLEAEAAAKRERERLEAEAAAKRERERLEAAAAAKRERERLEAEAAAKRERERLEAAAALKRERERREAEAAAKRERERLEAAAAARLERERREAEAAAKRERERLEAEAAAKRERARLDAEAAAQRERERIEAEAAAERERLRLEAEAAEEERLQKEAEELAQREAEKEEVEYEIDLDRDPFADFRIDAQEHQGELLKLMPVTRWARVEEPKPQAGAPAREDDLHDLMAGFSIPSYVAAVTYARGCRIRRVRVPAARPAPRSRMSRPVILSKRALEEARNDHPSGV